MKKIDIFIMANPTLQEVIRNAVWLPARSNSRGFYSVLCKVCNDHGRKGPRAGFKFDGDVVGYNCFNCGHAAKFDPSTDDEMSPKMREVLSAFGIPEIDWRPVLNNQLVIHNSHIKKQQLSSIEPKQIQLLPCCEPLTDTPNEWNQYAIEYLHSRGIQHTEYPFFIVNRPQPKIYKRWFGRLIIPVYKDNNLVYYQGRDLSDINHPKYLNPSEDRDTVLYGYHNILDDVDLPLYVTEGWFDAYHINGVAVFHHHMSPNHIRWLERTRREKVIIPDRYGTGYRLAQQAIDHGWSVSYPDIGDCKDVNDAFIKYGKLYTLKTIKENTCSGTEAECRLGIYCDMDYGKRNTN